MLISALLRLLKPGKKIDPNNEAAHYDSNRLGIAKIVPAMMTGLFPGGCQQMHFQTM
jgi:hypothetical protein